MVRSPPPNGRSDGPSHLRVPSIPHPPSSPGNRNTSQGATTAPYVTRRYGSPVRRETQRQPYAPGTSGLTTMGQPYTGGRKGEAGTPGGTRARPACRASRGRSRHAGGVRVRGGDAGRSRGRRCRGDPTWSSPKGRGRGAGTRVGAVRARARANVTTEGLSGAAVARACECERRDAQRFRAARAASLRSLSFFAPAAAPFMNVQNTSSEHMRMT